MPGDRVLKRGRQRLLDNPAADLAAGSGQRGNIVDVELFEPRRDPAIEVALAEEFAERIGRRRKPAGDTDALTGELSDHLPERSIFPADLIDVGHAEAIE